MFWFFFQAYELEQVKISKLVKRNPISFPDNPDPDDFVPFGVDDIDQVNGMIQTLAKAYGQSVRTIENDYRRLDYYNFLNDENMKAAKEKYLYNKRKKS